jgi:hypothetical protein
MKTAPGGGVVCERSLLRASDADAAGRATFGTLCSRASERDDGIPCVTFHSSLRADDESTRLVNADG